MQLRPLWSYFGSKYRSAPRYPTPLHDTIVEPFAGSAGYSLRYHDRKIVLVEKYPVVAGIWRYLIAVKPEEVLRIPEVQDVRDLPAWVPEEGRWLVGFWMNSGTTSPRTRLAVDQAKLAAREDNKRSKFVGWSAPVRDRVARQVDHIRHWQIIEGDYTSAPDVEATWFIDSTYQRQGKHYKHSLRAEEYPALADWCRSRRGQVIACEAEGADWLPFRPLGAIKSGRKKFAQEVVWTNEEPA